MKLLFIFLFLLLPTIQAVDINIYGVNDIATDKLKTFITKEGYNYTFYDMSNITVAIDNTHIKKYPTLFIDGVKYTEFNLNILKNIEEITIQEKPKKSYTGLIISLIILVLIIGFMIKSKFDNRFKEY